MKRRKAHNKLRVVSFKIPEENYNQIILHIPKGKKAISSETRQWKNFKNFPQ